jgi:NAD(P)H-dependent FMN reductase
MKLAIILGTTRQGRQTEKMAKWVLQTAQQRNDIQTELLDLKDYPMPFFDEPVSPRFNPERQLNEVVKKWLDKIKQFDAYIIVTPEYNQSIPGVLKNAFDYFDWQIAKKPFAIVSHGSAGGARAAVHLKNIISESKAIPISTNMAWTHRVSETFDDDGNLNDEQKKQEYGPEAILNNVLDELIWYSDALAAARNK